jgi:class 3 adenylate cyclase
MNGGMINQTKLVQGPKAIAMTAKKLRSRTAGMPLTLALALGSFTLLAVLSVVLVGAWSGYQNTVDLLRQKADVVLSSALTQLDLHLSAAENQASFLANAISEGEISPKDTDRFVAMMQGALAATPQISGLYFIDSNYRMTGAERTATSAVPVFAGLRMDPEIRRVLIDAQGHQGAYWADLLWRDEWQSLQVNMRYPVWQDGAFLGVMVANVSVPSLSEFMGNMESDFGFNAFILVDRQKVLAHPMMQFGFPGLTRWKPMPTLAQVGDPVLMSIWDEQGRDPSLSSLFAEGSGHAVRLGDETYLYIYREINTYGGHPWLVGSYLRASDLAAEFQRLFVAILFCGAILLLVLVGSVMMGRRISRPAQVLAREARLICTLDLDDVRPVPGSFFRELNEAAEAFNAMLVGLRWFEAYVPKTLVRRLIAAGLAGGTSGEVRQVTVLFTDIADFTGLSGLLTPTETAEFLNHHFSLISNCVLEEGGTIDKFIGDSVMAFWGAPEHQPDHAARALRAARAIARIVAKHGDEALPPRLKGRVLRVRVGVHAGPAVVGNIGSEERLNYTLVGQTVIIACRLEQFGRVLPLSHAGASTIVTTASTVLEAGHSLDDDDTEDIGPHRLRGTLEPVDLVRLLYA